MAGEPAWPVPKTLRDISVQAIAHCRNCTPHFSPHRLVQLSEAELNDGCRNAVHVPPVWINSDPVTRTRSNLAIASQHEETRLHLANSLLEICAIPGQKPRVLGKHVAGKVYLEIECACWTFGVVARYKRVVKCAIQVLRGPAFQLFKVDVNCISEMAMQVSSHCITRVSQSRR